MGKYQKAIKRIVWFISLLILPASATIFYEDAEDNMTRGWVVYAGSSNTKVRVENVKDIERGSRVIQLTGYGKNNGYRLGNLGGRNHRDAWNNYHDRILKWSMNYSEDFRIYISLLTKKGNRYLTYSNESEDNGLGRGGNIHHGLGNSVTDGTWRTFSRDLEADLYEFDKDNKIISVNGFFIYGSGKLDDILLTNIDSNTKIKKPVIILNGNSQIAYPLYSTYIDIGATAYDSQGRDITTDIRITGIPTNQNHDNNGTYIIRYNVSDEANNRAEEVVRIVIFDNIGHTNAIKVGKVSAVSTFESVGITLFTEGDDNINSKCTVRYREKGNTKWKEGLPLRFIVGTDSSRDVTKHYYRGSLVNLFSNTKYEYEVLVSDTNGVIDKNNDLNSSQLARKGSFKTWQDNFSSESIKETIIIKSTDLNLMKKRNDDYNDSKIPTSAYTIKKSGSKDEGYVLYMLEDGLKIDVNNKRTTGIFIENGVHHVILRNITIKNAKVHGIMIGKRSNLAIHDVIIEGCDISGWGREDFSGNNKNGKKNWGINNDSGIYHPKNTRLKRLVIQRNVIHDPRYKSNSWKEKRIFKKGKWDYHPSGPKGIGFGSHTGGNHVIRYNHIHANTNKNYFNDIMGGTNNNSESGFPHKDSDIYGNILEDAWDDAIESEGRNENCRIWGNHISNTYKGIATRVSSFGPLYIWRNICIIGKQCKEGIELDKYDVDRCQNPVGDATFHKSGGRNGLSDEGVYVFHNTVVLESEDYNNNSSGISGAMLHTRTANNILAVARPIVSERVVGTPSIREANYFLNELGSSGSRWKLNEIPDTEQTMEQYIKKLQAYSAKFKLIKGSPKFVDAFGLNMNTGKGIFSQKTTSKGFDKGIIVPNFNENFNGSAPDLGAHEAGTPDMQFGCNAYKKDK